MAENAQTMSLPRLADRLVSHTRDVMRRAKTEEDLRIGFEKILEPIRQDMGLAAQPEYERSIFASGRSDALHGRVVIEYESPRSFRRDSAVDHAFDQLLGYIRGLAKESKRHLFVFDPQFVGVGFDGEHIFFVRYRGDRSKPKSRLAKRDFIRVGPYPFDPESARTLLTHMRSLSRRLLTAGELAAVFGPGGAVAKEGVSALVDALDNWADSPRVEAFFGEWRRLFGIVYGEHFTAQMARETKSLAAVYGVNPGVPFQRLLFCVHTYFVFLMKLIVAELLTIAERSVASSFSHDLAHAKKRSFGQQLEAMESGGIYAERGLTNFLEGDFFRWYLDALSPRLEAALRDIARAFGEFEPATTAIAPEESEDLLKKLYQYLVPASVRHNLGEFYTPDWLAELLIRESRYTGNTRKRLLDPACGSGTFLVLAIRKAREYAERQGLAPRETIKRIVANVWGFDLNPLAVIAARTNYLFALGGLVEQVPYLEIPVYLADSVLWPKRAKQLRLDFEGGDHVKVATSAKEFHVPSIWVNDGGFLMKQAAPVVEEMARSGYTSAEALDRLREKGLAFPPHEEIVRRFYEEILELERDGRNGIWARFLKNAFAPMVAGRFDFVVGNPPWIRWQYLSEDYRNATLALWKEYGLFSLKGQAARLGGGEKDFSMLFTYAAMDYYVGRRGKLGFLITQEVLKSKGAGEGFRRFRLRDGEEFRVMKAADLVSVQPFEGAANKTAMIIARKGEKTKYPVPYVLYERKKGVGRIPTDAPLNAVRAQLTKRELVAEPMGKATGSWQTIPAGQKELLSLRGENTYRARLGARVEPYGVFWLRIEEITADGSLVIQNLPGRGKRDVQSVRQVVEHDLVYPAVSGGDVHRWGAEPGVYVLMPQNPSTSAPFPESVMKQRWPRTYSYLTKFRDVLLTRGSKTVREFAERTAFYAMYGIGPYTVAKYRVVWKRMAGDMVAAVISQHKTPFGYKTTIATDTTSLFPTDNESEAHYLCSVLNSLAVRRFIRSYSSPGRGFGAPSVMEPLGIPAFSESDALHSRLAELSMTLHQHQDEGDSLNVNALEPEVNAAARRLFGLSARSS